MNSKQKFDFYKKAGILKITEEEKIASLVNLLIDACYIPELGYDNINRVDPARVKFFNIDDGEPINWGDLKCNEVKKFEDGSYLVVIDEASPGDCTTFCEYIESYMASWGWQIRVETEW